MDNEAYFKMWGHLPFWEDINGFNKRVSEGEKKVGIINPIKCKGCNAEGNYTQSEGFCLGCTRDKMEGGGK